LVSLKCDLQLCVRTEDICVIVLGRGDVWKCWSCSFLVYVYVFCVFLLYDC
jgi:hypothetical protein